MKRRGTRDKSNKVSNDQMRASDTIPLNEALRPFPLFKGGARRAGDFVLFNKTNPTMRIFPENISAPLRLCVILLLAFPLAAQAQSAREIIEQADQKMRGTKSAITEMTITTVRPKWTREMTLKSWSKGEKLSLSVVRAPAKDKGVAFLKRDKEIWNWMPSIERTIKLPPSMMMQSWMGTDFTNDDLVRESSTLNDYTQKITGDSTILGRTCWKIQLDPKPDAAVVWGKLVLFIDQTDFIQLRSEMYDEEGILINVLNSSNIKEMGGKKLAAKMEMIPVDKPGNKTIMEITAIEFDKPIEDSFFSTSNMKTVK
jgi:outer membrane lipoprotein-sorting protein